MKGLGKHRSRIVTEGRNRAAARAFFKAVGFSHEDLSKPIIGIANTWIETMPCNIHLRDLAAHVKEVIEHAFAHFADRISRVEAHMGEASHGGFGPQGKHCLLEVRIEGRLADGVGRPARWL